MREFEKTQLLSLCRLKIRQWIPKSQQFDDGSDREDDGYPQMA
jgi:hypothetical protein